MAASKEKRQARKPRRRLRQSLSQHLRRARGRPEGRFNNENDNEEICDWADSDEWWLAPLKINYRSKIINEYFMNTLITNDFRRLNVH